MGQVLHGSATMIEVVRRAIQHSKESLRALAPPQRQSEDGRRVTRAFIDGGSSNRARGSLFYDADDQGGGSGGGIPAPHATAAG